jgi:hypothetical protein
LRILAAHLQRDRFESGGGALADERAHFTGAGEADGADVFVFEERHSGGGAAAADEVDDAGRKARIDEGLDEVVDGERGVGGGLDDAGVAGNQRGKELPTGDGHGEVPRSDEADDADGHADAHGELVLQLAGGGDAEEAAAFAGHVKGFVDGLLHVAAGFSQHLAHFAGHVAGIFFLAFLEKEAGADEDFSTFGRGNEAPCGKGFFGGSDGQGHILGARRGECAYDVGVVGGVEVEGGFAACGRQPLAANQILVSRVGHWGLKGY